MICFILQGWSHDGSTYIAKVLQQQQKNAEHNK